MWRDLASTTPSYFLSWGWVENWLACVPHDRVPVLALLHDGASACFLGRRLALRRGVVPTRQLHVNATGDERFDDVWIEYNGLVGEDLPLDDVAAALPGPWDELVLPGVTATAFGKLASARHRVIRRDVPAWHVRLDRVRAHPAGYAGLLSSSTRGQLRRAQRQHAAPSVDVARTPAEAIDILGELAELHGAQWRAKGKPGAFADPWFERFHRRLVARRFAHGEIQLVRVRDRDGTVGCLYNLVWRGRVLQYQSGLTVSRDPHRKPGYVCHAAAIEHAAHMGLEVYDFLGGNMRYKQSLSTDVDALVWATVQRRRLRFAVEDQIQRAVRAHRSPSAT